MVSHVPLTDREICACFFVTSYVHLHSFIFISYFIMKTFLHIEKWTKGGEVGRASLGPQHNRISGQGVLGAPFSTGNHVMSPSRLNTKWGAPFITSQGCTAQTRLSSTGRPALPATCPPFGRGRQSSDGKGSK